MAEIVIETNDGRRVQIVSHKDGDFTAVELTKQGKRKQVISPEGQILKLEGTIRVRAKKEKPKLTRQENWWKRGGILLDGGY